MANMLDSMDTAADTSPLDYSMAGAAAAASSVLVASWEYEENTIHSHYGWVPMAPEFSAQLEEAYAIDSSSVFRISNPEDHRIVWKIDLGKKTQRRLSYGIDQCERRIRRIYMSKDDVGYNA